MANAPRAVLPRTEFDRYGNKRSKLDTDLRMVKASFNSQIRKIKDLDKARRLLAWEGIDLPYETKNQIEDKITADCSAIKNALEALSIQKL